jgi:organic hydroperoxide reductase OsmC/OhrA
LTISAFPHTYRVSARGAVTGDVTTTADRLATLEVASPSEFGGPGDRWSPETLLVGAVADCFILTFRAIAGVSRLPWIALECDATGTLERIERVTQFTGFELQARLLVPAGTNVDLARRAMDKAEQQCLITNSLKASVQLTAQVETQANEQQEQCA